MTSGAARQPDQLCVEAVAAFERTGPAALRRRRRALAAPSPPPPAGSTVDLAPSESQTTLEGETEDGPPYPPASPPTLSLALSLSASLCLSSSLPPSLPLTLPLTSPPTLSDIAMPVLSVPNTLPRPVSLPRARNFSPSLSRRAWARHIRRPAMSPTGRRPHGSKQAAAAAAGPPRPQKRRPGRAADTATPSLSEAGRLWLQPMQGLVLLE